MLHEESDSKWVFGVLFLGNWVGLRWGIVLVVV